MPGMHAVTCTMNLAIRIVQQVLTHETVTTSQSGNMKILLVPFVMLKFWINMCKYMYLMRLGVQIIFNYPSCCTTVPSDPIKSSSLKYQWEKYFIECYKRCAKR